MLSKSRGISVGACTFPTAPNPQNGESKLHGSYPRRYQALESRLAIAVRSSCGVMPLLSNLSAWSYLGFTFLDRRSGYRAARRASPETKVRQDSDKATVLGATVRLVCRSNLLEN